MMRRDDGQTLAAVETRFGRLLIAETAGALVRLTWAEGDGHISEPNAHGGVRYARWRFEDE